MQQIQRVNLKALKRCDQVWEDMKPIQGGRQCELCQKKITDFRDKTLKEIAEAHVFSDKPVCGLYTENQLNNQENVLEIETVPWWSSIKTGYLSFASFLLTLTTSAQDSNSVPKVGMEQGVAPILNSNTTQYIVNNKYVIRGRVTDQHNDPLEFANVVLKSKTDILHGVTTNKNGEYNLDISSIFDTIPERFSLEFSFIGFSMHKVTCNKVDLKKAGRVVQLNSNSITLNEMVLEVNQALISGLTSTQSFGIKTNNPSEKKKNNKLDNASNRKQNWLGQFWNSIKSVFSKEK